MGTRRHYVVAGEPVVVLALPNHDKVGAFREFIETAPGGVLGLDVETTGLADDNKSPLAPDARLRLVQLASKTTAWVLDPHDPIWRAELWAAFVGTKTRFVSHTNYDVLWVRREFGIDLATEGRSIDTHTMTCLLVPGGTKDHTLKTWATEHIDPQLEEAETELLAEFKRLAPVGSRVGKTLKTWGFTNIPLENEVYLKYAGLDAIYVRRLLDILAGMFHNAKERRLSKREQRTRRQADRIEWRGHRVDLEWTYPVLREIEGEFNKARDFLVDIWGFPVGSPKRAPWLAARGVEFWKRSKKTGVGSLDKETIPLYATRYKDDPELGPIFANMLAVSERSNILNNLRTIVNNIDDKGFIHPHINIDQGVTGRMSIVRPALQTFKKTDKRLRGCFITRDGRVFVGADYDSQEIRIGAQFSQDPLMLEIIESGVNQHDATADRMYGPGGRDDYGLRHKAKIANFASQYGAGPKALAFQLKITVAEATELWRAWRKAYAGLVDWTNYMQELPIVVNPWGRRIPRDPWRPYANGNYMVQSSGRDVLGDALMALEDNGYGDDIWLPIHDEIILEVDEDRADDAVADLARLMYAKIGTMELTASAEIVGTRWSGGS